MKIAFLTEIDAYGEVSPKHPNMRTEFAWMHALNAIHHNIYDPHVSGYDAVIIIFPKGRVFLSAEGNRLVDNTNPVSKLLASDFLKNLKHNNKKVYYMQEGPHWWFNDYELSDQINFYNMVASCDGIFAHNESDRKYYKGMFPSKSVFIMPTLMILNTIQGVIPNPQEKVIIGGNFARWYGGFESYIVAQEFNLPIWGQTSHAIRDGESQMVQHLPRVFWTEWMNQLSTFKYAVHLMPTVAAGTFSLNCAYFGIPCIGNLDVDTQRVCHPKLSVAVHDIEKARLLAKKLTTDPAFYEECSTEAKNNYKAFYNVDLFKSNILGILSNK
jgi:hypothetical protein